MAAPSDLCAAFTAELRPFLPLLDVMPEPVVHSAESFSTFVKVGDSVGEVVWRVRISTGNELLEMWAESLTVDGLSMPVDTIRDDETEYAEEWAQRNADEFPTEGDG
jgi:hypothetical protein